ncbi:MAG TPA: CHAT domain-containing protein, partial [Nitriliruptorales bacterium]|nr:CHAT domain-containing protein [Nitriliruptorales bacterium]
MVDRCELLLSVRLLDEARALAERAVAELARKGMAADLAEARLLLAHAALLQGDVEAAGSSAGEARRAFVRQRRHSWAALARYTELRATWQHGSFSRALVRKAQRSADELDAAGWSLPALDARLIAARAALDCGVLATARSELDKARTARLRGPLELRARAWHAQALLRLAQGDRRAADSALRAGLRAVSRHQATLGATELRAHVSGYADELAALGLRLAIDVAQPRRVLRWAEQWRAGSLQLRPVRPPGNAQLATDLAALRSAVAELDQAAMEGRDTRQLLQRQARLERSVQRRFRQASGQHRHDDATVVPTAELAATLGERAMVELVEVDGWLHAVILTGSRARLRRLGPYEEALSELRHLRFALRRLAHGHLSGLGRFAAHQAAAHAADRLDQLTIGGLRHDTDDRPLVIVPTGALHATPWAFLPSCAGRPVTVAPSATLWHRSTARLMERPLAGSQDIVLVGCPAPPHAVDEVRSLSALHPDAVALVGPEATVAAARHALDGAGAAHLACHGHFRSDNPLFSSLQLADGPLFVYDLEDLGRAPTFVVLSACDSGLSEVKAGNELMGLAAALFTTGTATLIGSVVPVPDAPTAILMRSVHRHLLAGHPPADALARAQREVACEDEYLFAVAGFACFGGG